MYVWVWGKLDSMNDNHLITCKYYLTSNQRVKYVFLLSTSKHSNVEKSSFLVNSFESIMFQKYSYASAWCGRLWTHIVMAYVFTAWTCFILYREYMTICKMRSKFENNDSRHPEQYTVHVCYMFILKTTSMLALKNNMVLEGYLRC